MSAPYRSVTRTGSTVNCMQQDLERARSARCGKPSGVTEAFQGPGKRTQGIKFLILTQHQLFYSCELHAASYVNSCRDVAESYCQCQSGPRQPNIATVSRTLENGNTKTDRQNLAPFPYHSLSNLLTNGPLGTACHTKCMLTKEQPVTTLSVAAKVSM